LPGMRWYKKTRALNNGWYKTTLKALIIKLIF